jgi:hypothetical protein
VTLLDALRPASATGRLAPADDDASVAVPIMTTRQFGVLLLIGAVLLSGVLVLLFGPARGMRNDIAELSTDLSASREGIYGQLGTGRQQLGTAVVQLRATEQSLMIQEQGLAVAVEAEKDATSAAQATQAILDETRATLALVRDVIESLGPQIGQKIDSVVMDVDQAVRLARQTLAVAEQTLATGQQALAVARDTLATLKRSEQLQIQLLETARATLQETREINRKIPGAPIFPSTSSPTPSPPAP